MVKRLAVTGARRDGKMKAADCCSSGSNGPGGGSSGREEEGRPGRGRWESPPSQACSDADKIVRPRPRPSVRPANSPSSVLHYRQDRRSTARPHLRPPFLLFGRITTRRTAFKDTCLASSIGLNQREPSLSVSCCPGPDLPACRARVIHFWFPLFLPFLEVEHLHLLGLSFL